MTQIPSLEIGAFVNYLGQFINMDLSKKKCVPCEVGTMPLTQEEAGKYLEEVNSSVIASEAKQSNAKIASSFSNSRNDNNWELEETDKGLKIRRRFTFNTYKEGIQFVNKIAEVAEAEDHHPDLYVGYKKVTVNLTTHNIGGLSINDFVMAAKIEKIATDPSGIQNPT